jgi:hypothetical protein
MTDRLTGDAPALAVEGTARRCLLLGRFDLDQERDSGPVQGEPADLEAWIRGIGQKPGERRRVAARAENIVCDEPRVVAEAGNGAPMDDADLPIPRMLGGQSLEGQDV